MKSKAILCMFLALFAVVFAVSVVSAQFVTIDRVEVNDIEIGNNSVGLTVSDIVPVEVWFTALETATDVKVKVSLEKGGFKNEIFDITDRFNIVKDRSYVKKLTLKLPSSTEVDDLEIDNDLATILEDLDLAVRFTAEDQDSVEESYPLTLQRELYSLNVLSVDVPQVITAGSSVAIDVVVENNGNDELENVYVRASIPDLGIQSRVYVGDIDPLDESDYDCNFEDSDNCDNWKDLDREDTVQRKLYLTLPRDTLPGIYNLEVEAYNVDTSVTKQVKVPVGEVDVSVSPLTTTKTVAPGEKTTFSLPLVNYEDRQVVLYVTPEEAKGLIVEIDEPVIIVAAGESETIKVDVKATKSVEEGTYSVTVGVVNSETSELVKKATFTVNVEKAAKGLGPTRTDATFILTVVLVIIFVVLLIILIVLLTKKPAESEELGETSYY